MKAILFSSLFALTLGFASAADKTKEAAVTSPLAFKMKDIDGKDVDLSTYKGKVVLFVNVASKCGYTKQYTGLQALQEKYGKDGFTVIGARKMQHQRFVQVHTDALPRPQIQELERGGRGLFWCACAGEQGRQCQNREPQRAQDPEFREGHASH